MFAFARKKERVSLTDAKAITGLTGAEAEAVLKALEGRGVTHRSFFRNRHLRPLLEAGIVRMTNPASPNAANQRYILTKAGQDLGRNRQAWGMGKKPTPRIDPQSLNLGAEPPFRGLPADCKEGMGG